MNGNCKRRKERDMEKWTKDRENRRDERMRKDRDKVLMRGV